VTAPDPGCDGCRTVGPGPRVPGGTDVSPAIASEPTSGTWEIDVGLGRMVCGYCGETENIWPAEPKAAAYLALGYVRLTGYHALGVGPAGELVVLAEVERLSGEPAGYLPHLCEAIPGSMRADYAPEIAARIAEAAL